MKRVKYVTIIYFLMVAFQITTAQAVNCNPEYFPSGQIKKIDINDLALNIIIEDVRNEKDKYFFLWTMGWKSWDPDAKKFNKGQHLFLTDTPKDILKNAIKTSFFIAGYQVSEERKDIRLICKIDKFLYTLDPWKYGQIGFAEIDMQVFVEKYGIDSFIKEFYERSEIPFNSFRQVQDVEPTLSKCLSKIVEDVVMDVDLKDAILKAHGVKAVNNETPNEAITHIKNGTCFAISGDGLVATACHIIEGAKTIKVYLSKDSFAPAKIVKNDPINDLAILKLESPTPNFLQIAPTRSAKMGDKVFTIGFPVSSVLGRESKFTEGTISSASGIKDAPSLLQITVPIQPGNSGGPLINEKGEVVGVITSSAAILPFIKESGTLPQNINWAVKADYLTPLIELPQIEVKKYSRDELITYVNNATFFIEAEDSESVRK
ncbi:MAG: putative serine protease HhoB precursor [bacterium ADurb.Bin157]|nr:MAG: putative serine protease HhoB precursor [bacterium ADurb.Bin157]